MKIKNLALGVVQSITNTLKKIASLKVMGIFFLLFMISNFFINGKPFGLAQLAAITGGVSIPDMEMSGYSPQHVYDILTAQGEAGRAFYLHILAPQDFPFPLFYALFYAVTLTYLAQRLFPNNHIMQNIGLLGLLAGMADWMENFCLLGLLINYPQRLDVLAILASIFTVTKVALILLNMGLILSGFVWFLTKSWYQKSPTIKHIN